MPATPRRLPEPGRPGRLGRRGPLHDGGVGRADGTVSHSAAGRVPADPENVSPSNEAARLDRLGEPAPVDHLAVMYGKPAAGRPWYPTSLRSTLLSEAATATRPPGQACHPSVRETGASVRGAVEPHHVPCAEAGSPRPRCPVPGPRVQPAVPSDGSGRVRPVPQPALHPDVRRSPASLSRAARNNASDDAQWYRGRYSSTAAHRRPQAAGARSVTAPKVRAGPPGTAGAGPGPAPVPGWNGLRGCQTGSACSFLPCRANTCFPSVATSHV